MFYENPRDPAVNAALRDACDRLNQRTLSLCQSGAPWLIHSMITM